MKAYNKIVRNSSVLMALMVAGNFVFAQEYDDLYFTSKDRKEIKYEGETVTLSDESKSTYESFTNNTYSDKYSSHNVNPDYIARYQSGNTVNSYNNDDEGNANYSQPSNATVEYYDENNQYANDNPSGQTIINNNYYGNTNSGYYGNNGFYDPYYSNNWNRWNRWNRFNSWNNPYWGMNSAFYNDPFFGWGNSWSISVGFGNRWGNPWNRWSMGFGNRWGMNNWAYDPWFGYGSFYDPWYGGGWGSPYYNGWGWRNNSYYNGFNNGFYSGLHYNNGSDIARRDFVRGARSSTRGGFVSNSPRTSTSRSSIEGLSGRSDSRDFSGTQNEYFSRSRTSATSGRTVSSNRAATSRRTSSSGTYNNARTSSRSNSPDYSRSSSSSNSGRSYSNSSNNARSSGTTRRYNSSSYDSRSSSSSGRTYTPSNSRSSSSSSYRSNSSSRSSSGRSSGSYSSGSSRSSGSSYSPSRSSGSSSSGRSSGSSGSSSRSGRSGR